MRKQDKRLFIYTSSTNEYYIRYLNVFIIRHILNGQEAKYLNSRIFYQDDIFKSVYFVKLYILQSSIEFISYSDIRK